VDRGTYRNLTEDDGGEVPVEEAVDRGHVKVWLQGEKLLGGFALTRVGKGERPRWLLVKMDDEGADARKRRGESLLRQLADEDRALARRRKQPAWEAPMLATLTEERFSDPAWIFEPKLDGQRCVIFIEGGEIRLMSRNRLSIGEHYPELVEVFEDHADVDLIADGEIVAFAGKRTSFSRLQRRMHVRGADAARRTGVKVHLYVFDLLHVAGFDIKAVRLTARKTLLRSLSVYEGPVRFMSHRTGKGEAYWREACSKGWEGVIAKRADSPYGSGRSRSWLKFKCVNEQEFVIGGYTEPKGSRIGLGALLVGYYEGERLLYAGKVGTGFDSSMLRTLKDRLTKLERHRSPFAGSGPKARTGVHWVKPVLVGQVGFGEWTPDGRLRHPRFLGLRTDKSAREVERETAIA
jgi:bifunctional non-homologous end joining protein LigD